MAARIRKIPLWDKQAMTSGNVKTKCVDIKGYLGDAFAIEIILSAGTDDIDLSMQVSGSRLDDDVEGKTPYDSAGNDLSSITDAITSTVWIQFSPILTPYLVIKADPDATSTVTAFLYVQEDV